MAVDVQRLIKLGLGKGLDITDIQEKWNITSLVRARNVYSDNVKVTELEIHVPVTKHVYSQQLLQTWDSIQREMATTIEEQEATEIHFRTQMQISNDSPESIIVCKQFNAETFAFKELATSSKFETNLCSFLNSQFFKDSEDSLQKSPVLVINDIISNFKKNQNKHHLEEITAACKEFIATCEMTHYIHTIELGTMQYSTYSTSQYIEQLGPAMGPIGGPLESGKINSPEAKEKLKKIIFENEVGKSFEGEEVIGFSVLPVYMLVKQEGLREQLKIALKQYIQSKLKRDTSYSYYTIAGVSDSSNKVYWTVNQQNDIMGTPLREQATIFQFQEAGTTENPSQFLMRTKLHCKHETPYYYYLKFVEKMPGSSTKSLKMTPDIGERFSIHQPNRVSISCLCSASVRTLQEWKDEEEFHLRGSSDFFVGMKPLEYTETHGTYKICCAPVLQKKNNCTRFCIESDMRSDTARRAGQWESEKVGTLMEASQQS